MIKDCDLGGFNSDRFDIPLLEELLRAGVDFEMKIAFQLMFRLFHKKRRKAALSFIADKFRKRPFGQKLIPWRLMRF
jgi:DNA polymerase-3 subunit epsilon